jgi:hypothetical protein
VVVAGKFAPGADGGGAFLPVQPGARISGNRAEGGQGPGLGVRGGVFATAVLTGVHQRGDLGDVGAATGIGDRGYPGGPRSGWPGDERARPAAEAGVEDGGDVAGSGQVSFGDRVG